MDANCCSTVCTLKCTYGLCKMLMLQTLLTLEVCRQHCLSYCDMVLYLKSNNCVLCCRAGAMAKRIADKELTDRNWDQEEEGEEVSSVVYKNKEKGASLKVKPDLSLFLRQEHFLLRVTMC